MSMGDLVPRNFYLLQVFEESYVTKDIVNHLNKVSIENLFFTLYKPLSRTSNNILDRDTGVV